MNFSISSKQEAARNPNNFNNQQFIILGRILISLFAWKFFSLNSFGHLGHFGEDKTKSILFSPLNKYKKLCQINISYGSLKINRLINTQKSPIPRLVHFRRISLRRVNAMALNVVSKISLLKKQIFVTSLN